jgi:hypothetical protein
VLFILQKNRLPPPHPTLSSFHEGRYEIPLQIGCSKQKNDVLGLKNSPKFPLLIFAPNSFVSRQRQQTNNDPTIERK